MSLRRVLATGAVVSAPSWLPQHLCYETVMGPVAYGVSAETSDMDVYGICLPPKETVFPHLAGEIRGFGRQVEPFDSWQQGGLEAHGRSWDFRVFGVVRFFHLAMENAPDVIDSLFTPRRCVLSSTAVGEYLREHRTDFLHKGAWPVFQEQARSRLRTIRTQAPGYDVELACHVVRLLLEVEQILATEDLDLQRDREQLQEVRRGGWTLEHLERWVQDKERALEALYVAGPLPQGPDERLLKRHLLHCLELHYGDLSEVVPVPDETVALLRTIATLTERYR